MSWLNHEHMFSTPPRGVKVPVSDTAETSESSRESRPIPPHPSAADMERSIARLRPLTALISPTFSHTERVPTDDRPLLFVGNHTIYGMLDVPFLYEHLYRNNGIFLRALGDHAHFSVPLWRDWVARWGVVDGTRDNCAKLMEMGECILVFPGGAREATKRRGEKYQLIWANRLGFVRMAVRHGCTIVPFAALGAEDAFDIVMDADDLLRSRFGRLIQGLGLRRDMIPPIVQGIGATPIPRPERLYFWFGEPVETRDVVGRQDDAEVCTQLRDAVRTSIEQGIAELRLTRAADPKRHWIPRLGDMLRGLRK